MKKLFLILMTVMPLIGFSQSIGIKGGAVFSKMDLPFQVNEKTLVGPVLGIVYTQEINRFRIFIEPSFITKGVSEDVIITDNDGNPVRTDVWKNKFSYIEVPILLGYNIIDKDAFVGVNLGAAPGIIVDARVKSSEYKSTGSIFETNLFVMDIVAGAYLGYKFTDNLNGSLNLRYGKGVVSPIQDSDVTYGYFSPFVNLNYKF
jgi:hypothetical protein